MLRWQTIPLLPLVLALTLSMYVDAIANASIQGEPVTVFNENQLVDGGEESASSNSDSFDDADDRPESSDELQLIKLLRDPSKKFYPFSGSSSSSSSAPTSGGIAMLAIVNFHLPESDDRVQRFVCEDSILSFSEFVSRLLRPPCVS